MPHHDHLYPRELHRIDALATAALVDEICDTTGFRRDPRGSDVENLLRFGWEERVVVTMERGLGTIRAVWTVDEISHGLHRRRPDAWRKLWDGKNWVEE